MGNEDSCCHDSPSSAESSGIIVLLELGLLVSLQVGVSASSKCRSRAQYRLARVPPRHSGAEEGGRHSARERGAACRAP